MTTKTSTADEVATAVERISALTPDATRTFQSLMRGVQRADALSPKARSLFSLAMAVASRCEACVHRHTEEAAKAGVERSILISTLAQGVLIAPGPAAVYAAQALAEFDAMSASCVGLDGGHLGSPRRPNADRERHMTKAA